jgi:hypothetical protein
VVCGRVWLRDGSSDQAVLDQIFFSEEFNISRRHASSVSSHPRQRLARRNTGRNPLIEIVAAAVHDKLSPLENRKPEAEKYAYRVREAHSRGLPARRFNFEPRDG